jgi:hypothetical protein
MPCVNLCPPWGFTRITSDVCFERAFRVEEGISSHRKMLFAMGCGGVEWRATEMVSFACATTDQQSGPITSTFAYSASNSQLSYPMDNDIAISFPVPTTGRCHVHAVSGFPNLTPMTHPVVDIRGPEALPDENIWTPFNPYSVLGS